MKGELKDLAWSVLPKEAREEIRNIVKTSGMGIHGMFDLVFGGNVTSDEEPKEMLYVRREDVIQAYSDAEAYYNANHECADGNEILENLFGKVKCLPDPQPKPTLRFKIGDKVRIKYGSHSNEVTEIIDCNWSDKDFPYQCDICDSRSDEKLWFKESDLAPSQQTEEYMEENKSGKEDNFKTKELNLVELLRDCDCDNELFYSPMLGECVLNEISVTGRDITFNSIFANRDGIMESETFNPKGQINIHGDCLIWPSKESYHANPLDAHKAWIEWKESRTPKIQVSLDGDYIAVGIQGIQNFSDEAGNNLLTYIKEAVERFFEDNPNLKCYG